MTEKIDTLEKFEDHHGTMGYHLYDGVYAYTDGIHYLLGALDSDIKRNALMRYIVSKMNFRNYFGSFHLMVGKNETKICCYDPDMNIIDETILWKKCPLTPGIYKIFCYNYVVLAASEY